MSTEVTKTVFERVGISARKLRGDRIYDEARHTADPVHLMRLFSLGTTTAIKYITAAHPDKRPTQSEPERLRARLCTSKVSTAFGSRLGRRYRAAVHDAGFWLRGRLRPSCVASVRKTHSTAKPCCRSAHGSYSTETVSSVPSTRSPRRSGSRPASGRCHTSAHPRCAVRATGCARAGRRRQSRCRVRRGPVRPRPRARQRRTDGGAARRAGRGDGVAQQGGDDTPAKARPAVTASRRPRPGLVKVALVAANTTLPGSCAKERAAAPEVPYSRSTRARPV